MGSQMHNTYVCKYIRFVMLSVCNPLKPIHIGHFNHYPGKMERLYQFCRLYQLKGLVIIYDRGGGSESNDF